MTDLEWQKCEDPDLMLEAVERTATRAQLVEFVRLCWERIGRYLPPATPTDVTVVDQFAALAPSQSDHDAVLYAAEAALKAAGWAPSIAAERKHQADLLRRIIHRPHGV